MACSQELPPFTLSNAIYLIRFRARITSRTHCRLHPVGGPAVVVNLGTTINFDVVSEKGEFLGGMICPAVGMAIQCLFAKTLRLPLEDLRRPASVIG